MQGQGQVVNEISGGRAMRLLVILFLLLPFTVNPQVDKVQRMAQEAIKTKKMVQKERESWDVERKRLIEEYKALCQEEAFLKDRLFTLGKALGEEKKRISSIERSVKDAEKVRKYLEEYLAKILFHLKSFVEEDLPFYREDRLDEIQRASISLEDPSFSLSKKFRMVSGIVGKELGYGYSVETYRDSIELGGERIYGEILKVGRVVMYFRTPNGERVGWYVPGKGWEELFGFYKRSINAAFEIAEKRRAAELLRLPLGRLRR